MNKVYVILKRSYKFDDLDYGSFVPCFLSLDKEKAMKTFKSTKEEGTSQFHRIMKGFYKGFLEKHPERAEDFQIVEDTDDYFDRYHSKKMADLLMTKVKTENV